MPRKTARQSRQPSQKKKASAASTFTQKHARTVLASLSRKEADIATKLALEVVLQEGTVSRDRIRIYGPSLRIEKPRRRGDRPARMIWVRIRDRDRAVVHEVTVEAEKVVAHAIDADANPPFSDEERQDAYQVISNDPALRKLIGRKDVGIEWFSPHAHGRGRVIGARIVRVKRHQVIERIAEAEVELDAGVLYEGGERR